MAEMEVNQKLLNAMCTYDDKLKIWSGREAPSLFSPNLSIGEIIFGEMVNNPKLIAQVSFFLSQNQRNVWICIEPPDLDHGGHRTHPRRSSYECDASG